MEAADPIANSSKVIVQCHDPNNLFDQILPKLAPRLPLNKLHWKSSNRPLRSIDQLNVSFVRDESRSESAQNARRHQIPGLRQTPSVKVYLARCDDRENYKETCRKEIKQWLKGQGISQDGKTLMKGQERHDAYEYVILHVVLPGTPAAAQPKSVKHISLEASESTDSVNSKSKWTGKISSTIFDKLRADFSSSSKAPFERVAQVRIVDPESKQTIGLGPSEVEEQWQDFMEKLKTAILLSFDARVSQYEEDIREREAQRHLPGWNFCTFFILKEGLARGFENVGLIEDASTIYEELDIGLDSLVQEQAAATDPDPTSALLPFSTDLKPLIRSALDDTRYIEDSSGYDKLSSDIQSLIDFERELFPFDVERRGYQQRILTNQVSALDFHIYIFTRQLQLLFRQARLATLANRPRSSALSAPKAQYDLAVVAEICEKATNFINVAARALRKDLYTAWGGQEGLDGDELRTQQLVIDGIVASWKWSAIMQITADSRIAFFLSAQFTDISGYPKKEIHAESGHSGTLNGSFPSPQSEDLALWAGELMSLARRILYDSVIPLQGQASGVDFAKGLQSPTLTSLFVSQSKASEILRTITLYAYNCFAAAHRTNASHQMLQALAELEIERNETDEALFWLEQVSDLKNFNARTATDISLLKLYAQCLKYQGRSNDYAATLTTILKSSANSKITTLLPQHSEDSQYILNELIDIAEEISSMELPLDSLFVLGDICNTVSHEYGRNGFAIELMLSLKFKASIQVGDMELILNAAVGQDPTMITLTAADIAVFDEVPSSIKFISNIITQGNYHMTRLVIKIGNFTLMHQFRSSSTTIETFHPWSSTLPSPITVYPHYGGFKITARSSSEVDLTQSARLTVEVYTGESSIEECTLRLKPATAGTRLDIQSTRSLNNLDSNVFKVVRHGDSNVILLGNLAQQSRLTFEIPYSTEIPANSITIKMEAVCMVNTTSFSAFFQASILIGLPISVNVQDIFQSQRSFARFTATTSSLVPIRILKWTIAETEAFEITDNNVSHQPLDVFSRNSASWIVETVSRENDPSKQHKLPLCVQYQTYDEVVLEAIKTEFQREIENSPIGYATDYLLSHLLAYFSANWTQQELESATLLQEFEMHNYETLQWKRILEAFKSTDREELEIWLRSWHAQHQILRLHPTRARIREVKLSVDMPKPPLIVSTCWKLRPSSKPYVTLFEPVLADLVIDVVSSLASQAEIHFDVASQTDTWLVGGKKKGTLDANTQTSSISVILVAQRAGNLLLPSIDIKCRGTDQHGNACHLNVEIESRSQAKSVLVIPNITSTTIAVGGDRTTSQHWPIGNKHRHLLP